MENGTPNWDRFAEMFLRLDAERDGLELVPGTLKVKKRPTEAATSVGQG